MMAVTASLENVETTGVMSIGTTHARCRGEARGDARWAKGRVQRGRISPGLVLCRRRRRSDWRKKKRLAWTSKEY